MQCRSCGGEKRLTEAAECINMKTIKMLHRSVPLSESDGGSIREAGENPAL